jgi:hypothetical protein
MRRSCKGVQKKFTCMNHLPFCRCKNASPGNDQFPRVAAVDECNGRWYNLTIKCIDALNPVKHVCSLRVRVC